MKLAFRFLIRMGRTAILLVLVAIGSAALVRFAPGYLSDRREMDARYSAGARSELSAEAMRSKSLPTILSNEMMGWLDGSLGISRQFDVPVIELIRPRIAVTGALLGKAILSAWLLSMAYSLLSSSARIPSLLWQVPSAVILALPTAAMATVCLLSDRGTPLLVMTLLIAARDFKFLDRILRKTWREPYVLQARAQGIGIFRLLSGHVLPGIGSELLALCTLSIITALGALVPIEVIFNIPGLGGLAWNAALNRDLPVLLAISMLMAVAVTCAGALSSRPTEAGAA
jgi:peptide/nickel transport system permease protein